MAAHSVLIDGYDISDLIRVAHGEGLDPADSEYAEPDWAGNTAFTEGQDFAGDVLRNREIVIPIWVTGDDKDDLYQTKRDIESHLGPGGVLAIRFADATSYTYFDLERGRLEVDFQYWHDNANRVRGSLTLWVRPRGRSELRTVASIGAGGAGTPLATQAAFYFNVTGVLGDVRAIGNLEVRVGSAVASSGRVVAYGIHPHPSYNPLRVPSDGLLQAQSSSIATGASGAVASQYVAIPVSPTGGASGVAARVFLTPPDAHVGRHRVFALANSGLSAGIPLYAKDRFGAVLGPTAVASQTNTSKWQLIDLGEIQVPARASGQEPVPTQYIEIYGGGASGNTISASPALRLNAITLLPLDYSPGLLRTNSAEAAAVLAFDYFGRLTPGPYQFLEALPAADYGGNWSNLSSSSGLLGTPSGAIAGEVGPVISAGLSGAVATSYAAPRYTLASGAQNYDVGAYAAIRLRGSAPSYAAGSPAAVELFSKYRSNGWVNVKVGIGPSPHIAIITSADGAATSLRASAALAASGLLTGQQHIIGITNVGGNASAYIATNPDSPITAISASHGDIAQQGALALGAAAGPQNIATAYIAVDSLLAVAMGAGASDIGAREWFRFESLPERRTFQGNASVFLADEAARFRGIPPQIPAVGSGINASGAAKVVVLAGELSNFLGNDVIDVRLDVSERFSYLR